MAKESVVAIADDALANKSIFNDRHFQGCYALWIFYLTFCGFVISYEKLKTERSCNINDIEYFLCFLPFPVWNAIHSLYVYVRNTRMSHMARLLHCLTGLVSSLSSAAVAIWIANTLWSCSSPLIFAVLCGCVSVSILWGLFWAKSFRDIFINNEDPEYISALLLIFRCVCIPMVVKKVILCLPFIAVAAYLYVQLDNIRYICLQ